MLLSGCQAPGFAGHPGSFELVGVPFFAQTSDQCGPSALAAALVHSGVDTGPNPLRAAIHLPERRGSLQLELIAATRRHGRVPYVIENEADDLLALVEAGYPMVVLMNLGTSWLPYWHYAVVVGYDEASDRLVLRSGKRERALMTRRRFDRSWRLGGRWGLATLAPTDIPPPADPLIYVRGVAGLEEIGKHGAAAEAYEGATRRWPDLVYAWLGLGNTAYHHGDWSTAESAYRKVLAIDPGNAAAKSNLAQTLSVAEEDSAAAGFR